MATFQPEDESNGRIMKCGKWRLEREIGHGAYGVVYLAVAPDSERVAVKVCRRDVVSDERYARELRGAKLYRAIPHQDGLVRMRELVETEWGFYTVMDLADDEFASDGAASPGRTASPFAAASGVYRPKTLASVIDGEKALPLGECVKLGIALAKGLAALQRHHLLHRDIKPGNVIYVGDKPVLSDPGLVVEEAEAASLVGTPGYVPPEKFTDAASDIYSLGLTLKAASFGRKLEDLDRGPALEADTGAPLFPAWWRILNKATDPVPSRRYQSAKALLKELKALRFKMAVTSKVGSRKAKTTIIAASVGIVVFVGIVVLNNERMRAEVDAQKKEIARQRKEMSVQHERVDRQNKEMSAQRERIDRQQETIDSQKKEIAGRLDEIARYRDEISRQRDEIDRRAQEVAKQAKEVTGQIEAHSILTGGETNLVAEFHSLRQFKTDTENTFKRAEQETMWDWFLQKGTGLTRIRIKTHTRNIAIIAAIDAAKAAEFRARIDKLNTLVEKEEAFHRAIVDIRKVDEEKRKRGIHVTEEYDQAKKIYEKKVAFHKTEVKPLEDELDAMYKRFKAENNIQ